MSRRLGDDARGSPTGGLMPYGEIARRLGINKTSVMAIEKMALAKLALMMGDERPMQRLPRWVIALAKTTRVNCCSRCGQPGHLRTTCIRRSVSLSGGASEALRDGAHDPEGARDDGRDGE